LEGLNILSSVMLIGVYIIYIRQAHNEDSTPNPATWTIWFGVSIMNAVSYFSVVHQNGWKMAYVATATVLMCITFLFSLFRGKFTKLKLEEIVALVLVAAVGIFWKITPEVSATHANILLQGVFIISFVPTARRILDGSGKEKYPPWALATAAYMVAIISLMAGGETNWISYLYPIINGVGGNGVIAILSVIKKPSV